MKPLSFAALAACAWSFSFSALFAATPVAPSAGIAKNLQPLIDAHIIPGAVLLVANREKILDEETIGYADIESQQPMAIDSLAWIASMSKSFTATAFMMLVDEGKVSMDDPVSKYLPEFAHLTVSDGKGGTHPATHPMLVRHLLTHTSGASGKWSPPNRTLKEDTDLLAQQPLQFEPGTDYQYSNNGIDTAGRILELVTGQSYFDFLQQRLLGPLHLTNTTFWPDAAQAKHLAKSYKTNPEKTGMVTMPEPKNPPANMPPLVAWQLPGVHTAYSDHFAMPAGGIFSTAPDIARFCQMVLNGGTLDGHRYLSEKAVKDMSTLHTGDIPVNIHGGFGHEGYGYGWTTHRFDDAPSQHGFGHLGARKTMMWVDPDHDLVLVLMTQLIDISQKDQVRMYAAFIPAALEKFGRK